MAETMRTKILAVLAEASEPVDIQAVAEATGTPIKSLYVALSRPNRGALIEATDKGFLQIREAVERNLIESPRKKQEARSKKQEARRTIWEG